MIGSAMEHFRQLPIYSTEIKLYTFHLKNALYLLFALFFLTKKESTYCRFFSFLKFDYPKRFTVDFEVAVRNLITAIHHCTQIKFCFWYETKRLATLTITAIILIFFWANSNASFKVYHLKKKTINFELFWGHIGRPTSQGRHKLVQVWRVQNDFLRTKKVVERWNSNFVKQVTS